MSIEVLHSSERLPIRYKVSVKSVSRADKLIRKLMDTKRSRGMKLRYIPDYATRSYYLEARDANAARLALRTLEQDGNVLDYTRNYKSLAD